MIAVRLRRALVVAIFAGSSAALGACNEQLDAGSACPSLCPGISVPIKDTTLSAILVFDTTIVGYPSLGLEAGIPLASRGDTLDVRGVIRFDSLQKVFAPAGDTSRQVTQVDSAALLLRLNLTESRLPAWVRFDVYDVDSSAADNDFGALLQMFVPGRLVSSVTLQRAQLTDSLVVPIAGAWLLSKMNNAANVRFGIRLAGPGSVSLRLHTIESGMSPQLRYYVWPDTTVAVQAVTPYSKTPLQPPSASNDYRDFAVVAKNAMPAASPTVVSVGGIPARRAYLKFDVPQWLMDSTTIVRATLHLTQAPQKSYDSGDTVTVMGQAVAATAYITDLHRAADLLTPQGLFVTDSIRAAPADSGVRALEMNSLLRVWKSAGTSVEGPQRAIVLTQREEGLHGAEMRFFGALAPAAVRPRLRVSYIPRVNYGVP